MHEKYMEQALDLAEKGKCYTSPNPMVGAVIVKNGKVIGSGYHEVCGGNHAEVNAIESAIESVEGSTIYVTLEPCSHHGKTPPCADRIIKEKISKVVIAALDPNPQVAGRGVEKLRNAGIEVEIGVLEEESIVLNEVFMKYIIDKEPFVLMKTAMSLDGKIATKTGESKWISSEDSRNEVQELRRYLSGIMVGIGTVLADDPELTCRIDEKKNPIRIIVDSKLRIPLHAKVLKNQDKAKTIIATTKEMKKSQQALEIEKLGIEILYISNMNGKVNLKELVKELGNKNIDGILLEGGANLNYSAVESGIVDKVIAYIAPVIIGGEESKTPVAGAGISKLKDAIKLKNITFSKIGEDIKIEGYTERS